MKIIRKIITLVLMIAAPLISGKAFYEYGRIKWFGENPSYPFGKFWLENIQVKDISYLANYQNQMLSIGVVFLVIAIIAYLSMMFRALVNMIWLAFFLAIGYLIYRLVGQ